ncbi:MAG: class I SAM-dependent methyltransferase [Fimbriimonadaceae bacterium]
MGQDEALLQEQAAYYRARAGEYDEWFFRRGRYDRGPEAKVAWFSDVEEVRSALDAFAPCGEVLELACGTGLWTERLLPFAKQLTCVDASAEMIQLTRARVGDVGVEYVEADLFTWQPDRTYDTIFFGFWLSHVPPDRFDVFWEVVRAALAPGGRVFFVDSRFEPTSTAGNHTLEGQAATTVTRKLNDGREYQVVKVFYEPDEFAKRLAGLGFTAAVGMTPTYFLYGSASTL